MYHVQLRQFPHNFCRFNLTETELREVILDAWARGEWIEFGERKWNPQQAKLIVVEGPQIPLEQLSMGRGWRIAEREGKDVTEQLIATAHSSGVLAAPNAANEQGGSEVADALGADQAAVSQMAELLDLLGEDAVPLMRAWQLALEAHSKLTPSECLALAEALVRG